MRKEKLIYWDFFIIMIEYCYEIDNLCGFFKIVSNGG